MQREPESSASAMLPVRLPRGFVIGGYVIDGWLRDGGMAAIYRGRRTADERRVAIKLQLPGTALAASPSERFDREAEVLRRAADGRHVVDLLDAGRLDDGRSYLVLEWVEGENLEELLDALRNGDQRLPIARACRICRDVARGLAELHAHGVVHLDLKPANVMVRAGADGKDEVKLVDLGIAADLRELDGRAGGTPGAVLLGTSAYVAPEQLQGLPAAPAFDVYALGVLSFEALSGSSAPPHHWMPEALPRLETLRYGVPTALADLVQACMDVDPQRRPASALRVASELVSILGVLEAEAGRGASRAQDGPVRTGQTELAPRVGVVSVEASPEVDTEASADGDDDVPMRRPWLRWVVLGAAASLLVTWAGLGVGADAARSSETVQARGQESRDEPIAASRAPAAALASGSAPTSLAVDDEVAAPMRAGAPSRRLRRSESCKRERVEIDRAKAKRQWPYVLRMTAAGGSCWSSAEQRLQRKRLRVEAYLELREYEQCITAGDGSRDGEIEQAVRYCKAKLASG